MADELVITATAFPAMSLAAVLLIVRNVELADAARSDSRLISFKLLADNLIMNWVLSTTDVSEPVRAWLTAFDDCVDCTEIDSITTELRFIVSENRISTNPSCKLKSYDSSSGAVTSST